MKICKTANLSFGEIAPNKLSADTVSIGIDGEKTCGSSLTCFTTSSTSAAAFNVSGASLAVYDIIVPSSVTLNGIGDATGESMFVSLTGSKSIGVLLSGEDSFSVGGTLNVGADQRVGIYIASFPVNVEYQ